MQIYKQLFIAILGVYIFGSGCADIDHEHEYNNSNDIENGEPEIGIPSLVLGLTVCDGKLKRVNRYNYIQGEPTQDYLIGSISCEYDLNNRDIKEFTHNHLQGESTQDYIIGKKSISWDDDMIRVEIFDYLQGEPTQDYLLGADEYLFGDVSDE
jgi:hypothetical protein